MYTIYIYIIIHHATPQKIEVIHRSLLAPQDRLQGKGDLRERWAETQATRATRMGMKRPWRVGEQISSLNG